MNRVYIINHQDIGMFAIYHDKSFTQIIESAVNVFNSLDNSVKYCKNHGLDIIYSI